MASPALPDRTAPPAASPSRLRAGAGSPDIAIFLPSLAGGGAERVMVVLGNAFAERGKRVALVLAQRAGPYLDKVDDRVEVVDLGVPIPAATLALARYLRDERPGVLLSALAHANMTALVARRLAGVSTRVVVSERNTLSEVVKRSRRPLVSLVPIVMRFIYPGADGVIAVSRGVADDLSRQIGLPRRRIEVVYNPVSTADILAGAEEPLPHPWFDPGQPPVILTAGRLTAAKSQADLITAFARLRAGRPCRLVILGEGPLLADLNDQAVALGVADEVLFAGFQANPFNWMRNAALFVLPSRNEGFANALVEAMVCGRPIVSTDCPSGPPEILEAGKWGSLVPVGDTDALATALAATLDATVHPDVEKRAADFSLERALDGYARVMGVSL